VATRVEHSPNLLGSNSLLWKVFKHSRCHYEIERALPKRKLLTFADHVHERGLQYVHRNVSLDPFSQKGTIRLVAATHIKDEKVLGGEPLDPLREDQSAPAKNQET